MNSCEIVFANLSGRIDVRPGLNFCSDETRDWLFSDVRQNSQFHHRINDIVCAGVDASCRWRQKRWVSDGVEYYDDEWGNIWMRMKDGCVVGEIHTPAMERWEQLEQLQLPDYDDPNRYQTARTLFTEQADKFKIGVLPGWVFSTSRYLRKMEVYLCDLIEYPEQVERLHTLLCDVFVRTIDHFHRAGADGILFYEDLGTQTALLVSPALWRDVFKRHYQRLTDAAHQRRLKVFMHSCGNNWELLDDLIGVGINCFQFDQPAGYDMEALANKLKRQNVVIWSPIDIQHVLPTGDKILIEKEARKMIALFKGSLILKSYSDLAGVGIKPEWDMWGYEAILANIMMEREVA